MFHAISRSHSHWCTKELAQQQEATKLDELPGFLDVPGDSAQGGAAVDGSVNKKDNKDEPFFTSGCPFDDSKKMHDIGVLQLCNHKITCLE